MCKCYFSWYFEKKYHINNGLICVSAEFKLSQIFAYKFQSQVTHKSAVKHTRIKLYRLLSVHCAPAQKEMLHYKEI